MARFDSENGRIHLVFVHMHDDCYLPSTVKTDWEHCLLHGLKEAGYRSVFRWSGTGGDERLEPLDTGSAGEKPRRKLLSRREPVSALLQELLSGHRKTAVVVSLADFEAACALRSDRALQSLRTDPNPGGSILVICCSNLAEDNLAPDGRSRFLREEGALYRLLPEVRDAANPCRELYPTLRQNLGQRCVFLNDGSPEAFRNVVRRNLLFGMAGRYFPGDEETADRLCRVISGLYRSGLPSPLPDNPRMELKILNETLCREDCCAALAHILHREPELPPPGEHLPIYTNHFLAAKWDRIANTLLTALPEADLAEALQSIRRELLERILRGELPSGVQVPLDEGLRFLERQTRPGDEPFLRLKLEALRRYLEILREATSDTAWQVCRTALDSADFAQECAHRMTLLEEDIARLQQELQVCRRTREQLGGDALQDEENLTRLQLDQSFGLWEQDERCRESYCAIAASALQTLRNRGRIPEEDLRVRLEELLREQSDTGLRLLRTLSPTPEGRENQTLTGFQEEVR